MSAPGQFALATSCMSHHALLVSLPASPLGVISHSDSGPLRRGVDPPSHSDRLSYCLSRPRSRSQPRLSLGHWWSLLSDDGRLVEADLEPSLSGLRMAHAVRHSMYLPIMKGMCSSTCVTRRQPGRQHVRCPRQEQMSGEVERRLHVP